MVTSYIRIRSVADRLAAVAALVVALPVLAVVSATILATMGRPLFFTQTRIGANGIPFKILKFRTMVVDAEIIGQGYMPAELNLIPPLGKLLRRSSLDEIPQLINIARGEMAFVGPRPALPEQFVRYSARQARRVTVPQGVTGLAQVRYRNNATWSVRIEADLEYVDSICFWTDVRILAKTVGKVIRSDNVALDQTRTDVDDLSRPDQVRD